MDALQPRDSIAFRRLREREASPVGLCRERERARQLEREGRRSHMREDATVGTIERASARPKFVVLEGCDKTQSDGSDTIYWDESA